MQRPRLWTPPPAASLWRRGSGHAVAGVADVEAIEGELVVGEHFGEGTTVASEVDTVFAELRPALVEGRLDVDWTPPPNETVRSMDR